MLNRKGYYYCSIEVILKMDKTKIFIYSVVGITILVVIGGALVFFNIIPQKSIISWGGANSDGNSQNETWKTASNDKAKTKEEITADGRIYSFIGETMQSPYKPNVRPDLVKGPVTYAAGNLNPYHGTYVVKGQKVEVVDFSTMIAIMLHIDDATISSLDTDNAYKILNEYFIFPPTSSKQSVKERESLQGRKVFELSWENGDGTHDVRSLRMTSEIDSNSKASYNAVACHLYKENIGYTRGSCFEDLKKY